MGRQPSVALLASVSSLVLATAAAAQTTAPADGGTRLDEIIVTAQKRSENVQDIALAITAISGSSLQDRQIKTVEELSSVVPNVNFGTYGGAARIAIRGIGFETVNPGAEGRIAYHVDGVYVSRPSAQLGSMFDVDRVEVLRGPQGTLYGRNATGGSINVVTRAPTTDPSGYVNITVGNYSRIAVDAAVSGPIAEGVYGRLAVSTNNRSGYGKNEYTGTGIDNANTRGVRASVRFEPNETWTTTVSADYYRESDRNYGLHYYGPTTPGFERIVGEQLGGRVRSDLRNINSEFDPKNERETYSFTANTAVELGEMTLRSITGYRHSDYVTLTELDMTEIPLTIFPFFEKAHQFSQEFQLSGEFGAGSKWLVGAYYFDEIIEGGSQVTRNTLIGGGPNRMLNGYKVDGKTHTEAGAVFGQLDFALNDQISFVVGGRYGVERVSITDVFQLDFVRTYTPDAPIIPLPGFPRTDSVKKKSFTPKVGVNFKASEDVLLYATVSKGFKSGGYNLGVNVPAFEPEKIWAYEGGMKGTFADGRLRTNVAGFYYDYSNLQASKVVNSQVITENAAAATLYGVELEFTALPTDQLQFDGNLAWLESEYKDYSSVDPARAALGLLVLDGNRLTQAPKYTVNLGAQYEWPISAGSLTLRGEANYVSRVWFTAFNTLSVSQAGHTKFNAFLTFRSNDKAWSATLFGRNLADKTTKANGLISSGVVGFPATGSIMPPRTFGLQVGYNF